MSVMADSRAEILARGLHHQSHGKGVCLLKFEILDSVALTFLWISESYQEVVVILFVKK